MGAQSKRAKVVRKASEFDVRALVARMQSLRVSSGAYSWSLPEIQTARDAQMAASFKLPARLAESFRTDPAMYVAHRTRLAPQRSIPVELVPPNQSARALSILAEADALYGPNGVALLPGTLVTINSQLANHGVAFGVNTATPRLDGSRVDLQMNAWPIEWVRYDSQRRCYMTRIDPECMTELATEYVNGAHQPVMSALAWGGEIPITPGDGRWCVFESAEIEPWKDCAVLPGALTWARHAFGLRDWAKGSNAHGNAKVIGTLQEGVGIDSTEGAALLDLAVAIASDDMPVGIKPNGATIEYLVNSSGAWEIWRELAKHSESSASRIYLGHDASLGVNGAGPGVDMKALQSVANDIIEGDLHTIERGLYACLIAPWCAMNFGTSDLAPRRRYLIADPDQDSRRESLAKNREAFYMAIERERKLGFDVDEARIAALGTDYGVSVAKMLAPKAVEPALPAPKPLALAPAATG